MALLKATFLLVLFCFAQGVPEFKPVNNFGLQLALGVSSTTKVAGSKQQPLAEVDLWLSVYGDFNTSDKAVVTDFMQQKLTSLQDQSEGEDTGTTLMAARNGLPLCFNLTFTESLRLGPPPVRRIYVELDLDVYADNKHRNLTVALLNNFKPKF